MKTKITERDKEIIYFVHESQLCSFNHIYNKFFTHLKEGKQVCRNRLRRMYTYGYLSRNNERIIKINENSLPILENKYGITEIRNIYPSPHLVEVNDFKDILYLACQNSNFVIEDFKTYYNNRSDLQDTINYSHIPDGLFEISFFNKKLKERIIRLVFFEIDRGSEHSPQYLKMLTWYLEYFSSRSFKEKYNFDIALCLIVVPSMIRLNNMRKNASYLVYARQIDSLNNYEVDKAKHFLKFIWLTLKENIKPELILKNIWYSLDFSDQVKYGIN